MALGLSTAGTVNWLTDYITLNPYQTINKTMWVGNDTAVRDQSWIGMEGDTLTVADDASFDITTNLTLSADVYLPALPSTEKVIISKEGAYELLC